MALSKEDKKRFIKLQNILFNSNEYDLMVSVEFLSDCAKKYIVKHLRSIRNCMANIKATKNPAMFYGSIPPLLEHLDALILIEPYYDMSRPTPSAFKKEFLQNKEIYCSNLIKRFIYETKQHTPPPGTLKSPVVRNYFQDAFNQLMMFRDQMSGEEQNLVDVFYSGIFKRNYGDPIPAIEDDEDYDDAIEPSDDSLTEKEDIQAEI
jgi:hypothetical protein